MKSADILADIKKLLDEQLQVVTYKWLARQYGLPANTAKQLLFVFFEQNRKVAKATFLLAGWTKEEPRTHVVRLVDASKVLAAKDTLQPVTSYHTYSVQPSKPQDSAALANTDYVQLEKLFQQLLKAKEPDALADNCLANNSCSGVSCLAAVRDATLTKRPSDPAVVAAAAAEKAAEAAAGAKREDKARASSTSETASQRAAGLPAGKANTVTGSMQRMAGSKSALAASHLSGLWTKAPPKRPAAASAPAKTTAVGKGRAVRKAAAAPAADADAALRAAHEDNESSDDDDDDVQPAQRGGRSAAENSNAMLLDDDDGEQEQDESPAKPKARSKAATGRRAIVEDSSDDDMEDAQPPDATSTGAGAGDEIVVDLDMEPAAAAEVKPTDAAKEAKAPAKRGRKKKGDDAGAKEGAQPDNGVAGCVKINSSAPVGSKRRKVTKTSYNDHGEEVTEVVWEDEAAPQPAAAAGSIQMTAQPEAAEDASGSKALRERQANGTAVSENAGSQPAKKAASPKKAGKAAGKVPGKAPGKASGKGKTDPNQRGIMAFFNSK